MKKWSLDIQATPTGIKALLWGAGLSNMSETLIMALRQLCTENKL